jgi:hypothetical protein
MCKPACRTPRSHGPSASRGAETDGGRHAIAPPGSEADCEVQHSAAGTGAETDGGDERSAATSTAETAGRGRHSATHPGAETHGGNEGFRTDGFLVLA